MTAEITEQEVNTAIANYAEAKKAAEFLSIQMWAEIESLYPDRYKEMVAQINEEATRKIDALLTDETKERITQIQLNFNDIIANANARIPEAERAVRQAVLDYKKTVSNSGWMVKWVKGKRSIDVDALISCLDGIVMSFTRQYTAATRDGNPITFSELTIIITGLVEQVRSLITTAAPTTSIVANNK